MPTKKELENENNKLLGYIKELEEAVLDTSETKRFTSRGNKFSFKDVLREPDCIMVYFEKGISIFPVASNAFKIKIGEK